MRISDWSSDVCSSDLDNHLAIDEAGGGDDEDADRADARKLIEAPRRNLESARPFAETLWRDQDQERADRADPGRGCDQVQYVTDPMHGPRSALGRSEEHTSELQSLMRISYAVFCLKKKIHNKKDTTPT